MEITIGLYRREPTETGIGWRSVKDGTLTGAIVIQVDEKKLAELMGPRALRSKSKKSTLASGAIVARAVNLRRDPGAK